MSAIHVEELGKRYRIGALQDQKTFREAIVDTVKAPFKNLSNLRSLTRFDDHDEVDIIWALKNVSFDIKQGEAVGIIGSNGAGKSTLLKILSRITEPTTGFAEINGRVSSLLEVGTGFHPELTGRENVYLNATILGMRKKEIDRKFDEIVEFSGVEKFIDTPVKRYSSGMQVRLAFAVAAHIEPEILIVDEVLAVGDAAFQKKCLGKMDDVAKQGRTVLFVSHNMGAVASLTNRCIELEKGVIVQSGPSDNVIQHYLSSRSHEEGDMDGCFDLTNAKRPLNKVNSETAKAVFVRACCLDKEGKFRSIFQEREIITIDVYIQARSKIEFAEIHSSVQNLLDVRVFSVLSDPMEASIGPGLFKVSLQINPNYLRPGDYHMGFGLYAPSLQDGIQNALTFRIEPSVEGEDNTNWSYTNLGVVRLPYKWSVPLAIDSLPVNPRDV